MSLAPSLADLLERPDRAAELPPQAARELLLRLAPLHEALRLQALHLGVNGQPESLEGDRLLVPEEAARALGVNVSWLYRHSKRLPFARRLSRKALRFSEAGLRRWQAAKRA